jgi:hypothetical protein
MRQAIEKLMPLNGRRHLCLIMTSSYDEAPQDERAGIIRLITLLRRRGVRCNLTIKNCISAAELCTRYVSIVHGGQAAIDAAVLKLFPEWTDDASATGHTAAKPEAAWDHAAPSSASIDSSLALSAHDDLDEYLLEMDKDSVADSSFSLVDSSNMPSAFATKNHLLNSRNQVGKDSASFVSGTEGHESATVARTEEPKSNLEMLSVSAVRLRLLKRAPQVSAYFETGDVPCSDLDAGKMQSNVCGILSFSYKTHLQL